MLHFLNERVELERDRVLGMNKTVRSILETLLPSLLPAAILAQLKEQLALEPECDPLKYPQAVLLTGSEGSGKTHLAHAITSYLVNSPRVLATSHVVSCKDLGAVSSILSPGSGQSSEVNQFFSSVKEAFQTAIALCDDFGGPCILVLDDIQAICPRAAAGAEGSGGDGGEGNYNECNAIITLLVERLLLEIEQRRQKAREAALAILSSSDELSVKGIFSETAEDRALSVYLSGTIVFLPQPMTCPISVIASCDSCCGRPRRGWVVSEENSCASAWKSATRMTFLRHSLTLFGCKLPEKYRCI